jgi:C4-dicarboxylate-specific signal transduction histidine kinase
MCSKAEHEPSDPKVILVSAALLLVALVAGVIAIAMERQRVLRDGLRAEASVVDKSEVRVTKKRTEYRLKVALLRKTRRRRRRHRHQSRGPAKSPTLTPRSTASSRMPPPTETSVPSTC